MQKRLFKWQKWRYNTVDKKITKLDSVRSDSPQRLLPPVWEVWKAERKKIKNKNTFDFLKEESVMAKTKIAVLWGLLIAMMVACAGIYAALKAREINPYIAAPARMWRRCSRMVRRPPSSRTTWSRSMTEF